MRSVLKITWLVILAGFSLTSNLHAQPLVTTLESSGTDSVVSVVAAQQGLPLLSPDQVPPVGTFWFVVPGGAMVPMPGLPPGSTSYPVYAVTDGGEFLVDGTSNQIAVRAAAGQPVTSAMISSAVTAEAGALTALINNLQAAQFAGQMRRLGMADDSSADDDSGGGYAGYNFNTNQLWLEITNLVSGTAYLNLYNATDQVYAIYSTTDLTLPFGDWQVETEVWPTDTNCQAFTVPAQGRQNLFLCAEDWTGVTNHGNGTPEWWFYYWFGTVDLSDTNLDANGNMLASDYLDGADPDIIQFSVAVTNNYVSSLSVPVQLNITAGLPSYVAVLVDDTNYAAAADWQAFAGTNLAVNLGLAEGWHNVWIGLRGHGDDPANGVWQCKRLKLEVTPPLLVITQPSAGTVDVPLVQIQGYSPEELAGISYDLSNALEVATNQAAGISGEIYDTNSREFTTNYFACVDVPLTSGVNLITLRAADEAGNTTTTNISITLDGSGRTNPPAVNLYWPQDGTLICNSSYTWRGRVDDPTASVSAQLVDTNGNTNIFNGIVERDGHFWIENLPLAGTDVLTLAVTDWLGHVAVTNITVYPGAVALTIDAPAGDELWSNYLTVTGTVGGPDDYTVWVNGVKAANHEDGTWEADNVPGPAGGTWLMQARAIPNTDNGGNGTGGSGGGPVSYENIGNPDPPQDNDAELQTNRPARIYMKSYHESLNEHAGGITTEYDAEGEVTDYIAKNWDIGSALGWDDENGGSGSDTETTEQIATGYDHTLIEDDDTSVFPAEGAGTITYDWTDTDFDNPAGDDSGTVSYEDTPALVSEHCGLTGALIASRSHYDSSGGDQQSANVTFDRNAQTAYELQTGGKGVTGRQNLFVLSAHAQSGTLLLQPGLDEDDPWNYAAGVPVDPAQVQIMGENLDTNGNVYVMLADSQTAVVTPQVKGKDYYTWSGPTPAKYSLIHQTENTALTDTNLARLNLGVGEQVDLSGMPANTIWSTSAGGLSGTNGSGVTFTAPSNAANATVTAIYENQTLQVNFGVIAPSGVDHAYIYAYNTSEFPPGMAGVDFNLTYFIAPTSVSFYRVEILEVEEPPSSATGYFSGVTNYIQHAGWAGLGADNHRDDELSASGLPPPWDSGGSLSYDIPALWMVPGTGLTNSMSGWSQTLSIDSAGTTKMEKFGHWGQRTTNNIYSFSPGDPVALP